MSTRAPDAGVKSSVHGVLVAECGGVDSHLMVSVEVDPGRAVALRAAVVALLEADGLWCGPAAASSPCREGLLGLVVAGGISAEVVDAGGYDDQGSGRAACLREVARLADAAGHDGLLLVRDDACAAADVALSGELARQVGATPTLRCCHVDTDTEPLVALAEVLVWCWSSGGGVRRSAAVVMRAVHLV